MTKLQYWTDTRREAYRNVRKEPHHESITPRFDGTGTVGKDEDGLDVTM
jgi:hypothetical protein